MTEKLVGLGFAACGDVAQDPQGGGHDDYLFSAAELYQFGYDVLDLENVPYF